MKTIEDVVKAVADLRMQFEEVSQRIMELQRELEKRDASLDLNGVDSFRKFEK
jgi:hypothetical protein